MPVISSELCIAAQTEHELQCPNCGDPWLHHGEVTVYSRPCEDGKTQETRVDHSGRVQQVDPKVATHNPSARRDGVAIDFWCETCHHGTTLTIAQHKGNTVIEWRSPRPGAPPHPFFTVGIVTGDAC